MFDLELFLSAFITLFVIIDPIAVSPLFVSLTEGTPRKWQVRMAIKSSLIAGVVLAMFAYGGEFVFDKMGISMEAFRIAGGLLLFLIALEMVFEKRTERRENRVDDVVEENEADIEPHDVSVFPLAIPMMAGPGAIATMLLYMSERTSMADHLTLWSAVGAVLLVSILFFIMAAQIMKLAGATLTNMLTRLFGVILAALAAQFVLDGVVGALGLA